MELTNIEVLVFAGEDGEEIEMQIVDEFELEGESFIALVSAQCEDGDEIEVYKVLPGDEFESVDDAVKKDKLLDIIEQRIMERY